jgi:predicted O-methyltransferase YrrM
MALPTLQIVEKSFRKGAVVVTDNTIGSAVGYESLLKYLRDPVGRYTTLTMPYHNGLELSVYKG